MSESTDIRNKQADATEAVMGAMDGVVPAVAAVTDAFRDAFSPEAGVAVADFFEQIGLARGVALSIVGTTLGQFVGGCYEMKISVEEMVDSLMHLYLCGSLPVEQMLRNSHTPDNHEHLEASKEIVRAALCLLDRQVLGGGHDVAVTMRKYLTLLVSMVHEGSAKIEAQLRERKIDD